MFGLREIGAAGPPFDRTTFLGDQKFFLVKGAKYEAGRVTVRGLQRVYVIWK